jgi:hypothetical protein
MRFENAAYVSKAEPSLGLGARDKLHRAGDQADLAGHD